MALVRRTMQAILLLAFSAVFVFLLSPAASAAASSDQSVPMRRRDNGAGQMSTRNEHERFARREYAFSSSSVSFSSSSGTTQSSYTKNVIMLNGHSVTVEDVGDGKGPQITHTSNKNGKWANNGQHVVASSSINGKTVKVEDKGDGKGPQIKTDDKKDHKDPKKDHKKDHK